VGQYYEGGGGMSADTTLIYTGEWTDATTTIDITPAIAMCEYTESKQERREEQTIEHRKKIRSMKPKRIYNDLHRIGRNGR
jgi:hypothetical protein